MKKQMLVRNPENKLEFIEVHISGGYFDESRVLWTSLEDRPIPESLLNQLSQDRQERESKIEERQRAKEARDYLKATDWLVIREIETGEPVPQSIKTQRQDARDLISANR